MKKFLIGIGSLVVLLLAVTLGGGFILLQTVDLEKVKSEVIALVKQKTGRDLTLGALNVDIGFSPTIRVTDASVSNPAWAKNPSLMQVKQASLSFDILPLFSKQLKINAIDIDGLNAFLESSKTGDKSWDLHRNSGEAKQAARQTSSGFSLSFSDVDVKDIRVNYLDQATGKKESVLLSKVTAKADPTLSLSASAERGDGLYDVTATGESLEAVLTGAPVEIAFNAKSRTGDAAVTLKGAAKNLTLEPSFSGTLTAKASSLAQFGAFTATTLPASEPLSLQSAIDATSASVTLSTLEASVGDKKGTGSLTADLSGPKPYLKGTLTLPSLTLAREDGNTGKPGTAGAGGEEKAIPNITFPTAALDKANADLSLAIGTLTTAAQTLQKIEAKIALHDGTLRVAPFSFLLEDAPVNGSLSVSAARAALELQGKSVPVSALAKAAPVKGGVLSFNIHVAGQGKDLHAVLSTLNGRTSFFARDAVYQLKHPGAAALFKTLNGGQGGDDVTLSCAAGSFAIAEGIASTNAVVADTDAVRVDGSGSVDLAKEQWKMLLTPTPKAAGLNELAVPLRVSGTFKNPRVVPDPAGTALTAAKVGLGLAAASSPAGILGGVLYNELKPAAGDEGMKNSPCFQKPSPTPGSTSQKTLKDVVKEKENEVRSIRDNLKGLKDLKLF